MTTISDKLIGVDTTGDGVNDYYDAEFLTGEDYYAFGSTMPGRSFNLGDYRYEYNGFEKDDEVSGTGNHISFNDFGLDTRLGRRWNTDPKSAKAPNESPYAVFGNNPIFFIDPDGNFKLNYTEKQLKDNGLTKLDVARFENIVNNIYNLVKDNPQALSAIANTTGFTQERIAQDFQPESGPSIDILPYMGGARGGASGIVFDPKMVKSLADIDGADKAELSEQTLGVALTVIHEYGHYGDQTTNGGNNTGQYSLDVSTNASGGTNTKRKYDTGSGSANKGKQKWGTSLTGHRGTDIEVVGFGVQVSVDANSKTIIEKGKLSPTTGGAGTPSVPSSLPKEAKGEKVLETLKVQ